MHEGRRKWTLPLATAAVAAALLAAGCGDDGDDGDDGGGGGEPLTKQEFIAQAEAICKRTDEAAVAEAEDYFAEDIPTPEEIERYTTEVIVPKGRDQVAQLRELTPPEADQETIDSYLEKAEEGLDLLEEDPAALTSGPTPEPFVESGRIGTEYGLKACGQ